MKKIYTCIICPNSCEIETEVSDREILSITGNLCPKGDAYVRQEILAPERTIATSVLVANGVLPLVSVRLVRPIPKNRIFDVMEEIKKIKLQAPVASGDIVRKNILGLGSDIIATRSVQAISAADPAKI
jgi:CxxC motif-containing protein